MAKPITIFTREEEYETQMYGFCQKDLIEHFKSSLHEQILSSTSGLKKHFLEVQTTDEDRKAVEAATGLLVEQCLESSSVPMEGLEEQLQTIFRLPPHILLPEDKVQRNRYTQEDEEMEKRELDKVKSRFRRAQYLKALYKEELKKADQLASRTKCFDDALALLQSVSNFAKDNNAKQFHKLVQDLLGAEVSEASLKLSDLPSCGESDETLKDAIVVTRNKLKT